LTRPCDAMAKMTRRQFDKAKNIADLDHSLLINLLNVLLALAGSLLITFWIAFSLPDKTLELAAKIGFTDIVIGLVIILSSILQERLQEVRERIKKLR